MGHPQRGGRAYKAPYVGKRSRRDATREKGGYLDDGKGITVAVLARVTVAAVRVGDNATTRLVGTAENDTVSGWAGWTC